MFNNAQIFYHKPNCDTPYALKYTVQAIYNQSIACTNAVHTIGNHIQNQAGATTKNIAVSNNETANCIQYLFRDLETVVIFKCFDRKSKNIIIYFLIKS